MPCASKPVKNVKMDNNTVYGADPSKHVAIGSKEAYCWAFDRPMDRDARTFGDMVYSPKSSNKNLAILLSFVCEAMYRFEIKASTSKAYSQIPGRERSPPAYTFLECVMENKDPESRGSVYSSTDRRLVTERLTELAAEFGFWNKEKDDDDVFPGLKKEFTERNVVQYRIWFYVMYPGINFAATFDEIIAENEAHMAKEDARTPSGGRRGRPPLEPSEASISQTNEKLWMRVDKKTYLSLLDSYIGGCAYSNPNTMAGFRATQMGSVDKINPMHPNHIFNPVMAMFKNRKIALPEQNNFRNYVKDLPPTVSSSSSSSRAASGVRRLAAPVCGPPSRVVPQGMTAFDRDEMDFLSVSALDEEAWLENRVAAAPSVMATANGNNGPGTKGWCFPRPWCVLQLSLDTTRDLITTCTPDYRITKHFGTEKKLANNIEDVHINRSLGCNGEAKLVEGAEGEESRLTFTMDNEDTRSPEEMMAEYMKIVSDIYQQPMETDQGVMDSVVGRDKRDRIDDEQDLGYEMLSDSMIMVVHKTDYDRLHKVAEAMKAELRNIRKASEYRRKFKVLRDWLMMKFCDVNTNQSSEVGETMRAIMHGAEKLGLDRLCVRHRVFDPEMGVFCNMIARQMESSEQLSFFIGAHRSFLVMSYGTNDVYREAEDLHFNVLMGGPAEASKSFIMEELQKQKIPGSFDVISHVTTMAFTGDRDRSDLIVFMNEVNLAPLSKENAEKGPQCNIFKDMMTRSRVTTFQLVWLEGRRLTQMIDTKQQQCLIMASNQDVRMLDPAFVSRLHLMLCMLHHRFDRNITLLENVKSSLSRSQLDLIELYRKEMQRKQWIHALVEKAIHSGILHEPTLTITDYMLPRLSEELFERKRVQLSGRLCKRMRMVIRQFVISLAIEYIYNIPGYIFSPEAMGMVPNFYGKPFSMKDIHVFDPYLRDELSIFVLTVGLFQEELEDPLGQALASTLRAINMSPDLGSSKNRFLTHVEYDSQGTDDQITTLANRSSSSSSSSSSTGESEDYRGVRRIGFGAAVGHSEPGKRWVEDYNYALVCSSDKIENLCQNILSRWTNHMLKPGINQIRGSLEDMKHRMIPTHQFVNRGPKERPRPVEDPSTPEVMRPVFIERNGKFYVLSAYIFTKRRGDSKEGMHDLVRDLVEHHNTEEQKMLYGDNPEKDIPQCLRAMYIYPKPDKVSKAKNPYTMSLCSRTILGFVDQLDEYSKVLSSPEDENTSPGIPAEKEPYSVVDQDDDTIACMKRLSVIGVPLHPQYIGMIHPRFWRAQSMIYYRNNPQVKPYSYPEDSVAEIERKRQRHMEMSSLDSMRDVRASYPHIAMSSSISSQFDDIRDSSSWSKDMLNRPNAFVPGHLVDRDQTIRPLRYEAIVGRPEEREPVLVSQTDAMIKELTEQFRKFNDPNTFGESTFLSNLLKTGPKNAFDGVLECDDDETVPQIDTAGLAKALAASLISQFPNTSPHPRALASSCASSAQKEGYEHDVVFVDSDEEDLRVSSSSSSSSRSSPSPRPSAKAPLGVRGRNNPIQKQAPRRRMQASF